MSRGEIAQTTKETRLTSPEVPLGPLEVSTAQATFEEAVLLQRKGRTPEAEELYQTVLAHDADHPGAIHNLSVLCLQRSEFEEASRLLRRLVDLDPSVSEAHNNLGIALNGLKRPADAVKHFEKAIELAPQYPGTHYNLGRALQALGRFTQARERFERAIALRFDYADAHNSLGVLLAPNDPEEALACFHHALKAQPNYADAHNNIGNALQMLGRHEEARASYMQALAIKPDHADAHNNLGMALRDLNRHEEAIGCFEIAQAIKPDHVDAHLNEGLVRLALGDYASGWTKYAWRHLTPSFSQGKKRPLQPLWLGQWNISGSTILLHGEQGLGDTIQFSRYVPQVAKLGGNVILAVQRPLAALMAGLEGASVVRGQGDSIPPFDCYCPLPSLPLAFRTIVETIPADVPYLSAPPDLIAKWQPVLQALGRPLIGMMWAQSPVNRRRSIPLRFLLSLFELRGFQFVALQKEVPDGDAPLLPATGMMTFLGERQLDLTGVAAIISMLDLLITIDTSIAHLAGALGKPVWVLLPFSADWRWLRYRSDSPWYPTARLFRQSSPGDWASVVAQVKNELRRLAH
jgi:tetratricopeptide (TPR) repeat protein